MKTQSSFGPKKKTMFVFSRLKQKQVPIGTFLPGNGRQGLLHWTRFAQGEVQLAAVHKGHAVSDVIDLGLRKQRKNR